MAENKERVHSSYIHYLLERKKIYYYKESETAYKFAAK